MEIKNIRRPWEKKMNQGTRNRGEEDKFYHTSEWKRVRASYLAAHPHCECDECKGKRVSADMVDHKIRIKAGGSKTDWSNLQSLTNKCHAKKSAKEANEAQKQRK